MAEPTLGRRIMIEATICKDAPAGSAMASKAWADLRTLCARADAAERLAVTAGVASAAADTAGHAEHSRLAGEFMEALAAWRAITEEAQP